MKVTLTNIGPVEVPFTSKEGLATKLEVGVPFELDEKAITVATVGDNPSFKEDLEKAVEGVALLIKNLITFWKAHPSAKNNNGEVYVRVRVQTQSPLRVLLGDDRKLDEEMKAGDDKEFTAPGYIELRELGLAKKQVSKTEPEAP